MLRLVSLIIFLAFLLVGGILRAEEDFPVQVDEGEIVVQGHDVLEFSASKGAWLFKSGKAKIVVRICDDAKSFEIVREGLATRCFSLGLSENDLPASIELQSFVASDGVVTKYVDRKKAHITTSENYRLAFRAVSNRDAQCWIVDLIVDGNGESEGRTVEACP